MRTAIITGALCIGDAIRTTDYSENLIGFYGFIIIASIVMDLVDFFRNK